MKFKSVMSASLFALILTGCTQDDTQQINAIPDAATMHDQEIVEGKLYFESRQSLDALIGDKSEEDFRPIANKFRDDGFKPLAPMFKDSEDKERQEFIKKKKKTLLHKSGLYTEKNFENADVDEDDELIMDPRFAALLNEDREIIVGDTIYAYTMKGLFYSHLDYEKNLHDYLDRLDNKISTFKYIEPNEPCDGGEVDPNVYQYVDCGGGGGGGGGTTPPTPSYDDFPLDIKRNLPVCEVDKNSLWQQIFGEAETCHNYFADDRRAKVKYWNQNYFIFSSIGMQVKHQKRNWGIWDSSSATDYIEMGLTNVSFKYNFNTDVYGPIFDDMQNDILFEYKDNFYTTDGGIIYGYPIQASPLPFTTTDNDALTVYLFNRNIDIIDEQQANNMIRDAARDFIADHGNSLNSPMANTDDDIGLNGLILNPLDNSVTYTIVGQIYRVANASSITKILDYNFLVGYTHELGGGSYTQAGVKKTGISGSWSFGATSYTDVTLDMYGVVRRNGDEYRGGRIISDNIDSIE